MIDLFPSSYVLPSEPPKIILAPQDKNATEGTSATFYCRAEGDPQPAYTWFRGGGDPLQDGEKYTLGDTNRELTIKNLVKNDLGSYTCQAENAAGIDQKSGFLNVFIPPLMNVAENETRDLNQMVEFSCYLRKGEEDTKIKWKRVINGIEMWFEEGKQVSGVGHEHEHSDSQVNSLTLWNAPRVHIFSDGFGTVGFVHALRFWN